mmetsp:Transcript_34524/g.48133  ORF Transcript_34524/g.48133 Transcript_34524/m.48133 type:complete len:101 (+) Transcript_34524:311-613(+)
MAFRGFAFNQQQQLLSQPSECNSDSVRRSPNSCLNQFKDEDDDGCHTGSGSGNHHQTIMQRILNYVPSYADVSKETAAREKAGKDWHQMPSYRRFQEVDD